jgi:hemin uptake protein HemP
MGLINMSRPHPPAPTGAPAPSRPLRRLESLALFQGEREIVIVHRGLEYRLRVTRAEKLILTK